MAVHRDQQHRHVGPQEQADERGEGGRRQQSLPHRRRPHGIQQLGLAALQPDTGEKKLQQRQRRRQPQGGQAELGDHARMSAGAKPPLHGEATAA